MTARVGKCQEVNKPSMMRIHGQIWSNAVPRRLHRSATMALITFLYPQKERHVKSSNFNHGRLIKTHTTNRTPRPWNTTYASPADKVVSLSDDINKTDSIVRMAPPDTDATRPNATKCSDLISTESDAERDHDKQRKETRKIKTNKRWQTRRQGERWQHNRCPDYSTYPDDKPQTHKENQSRQRCSDGTRKNKKSIETENVQSILTIQLQTVHLTDINMLYTYKIATLNINGISLPLKIQMLNNFLLRQDIDIALLQEVTNNDFSPLSLRSIS